MSTAGIILRPSETSDLPRLLALADNCPGAPRWALRTWQQVLESSQSGVQRIVLIAESVSECVGFGVLGLAADDAEIESLAVSTSWRRRGIAKRLCKDLLGWAHARGVRRVSLEVRVSNMAARTLYESLGFHEVAVRRSYYQDPEEDALFMTTRP
jgi:[ribosomal protein S18]-alanine N-acetyltransferase